MPRGRKTNPKPEAGESPPGYAPPAPSGMGKAARAKWRVLVPLIARQVPLRDVDVDALRQYCDAVVLREKAVHELEDAPLLESGPNGARYASPLLKIIAQQEAVMMKLAERFGLDPASRRRLQVETSRTDSVFTEFLKRGRDRARPEGVSTEPGEP